MRASFRMRSWALALRANWSIAARRRCSASGSSVQKSRRAFVFIWALQKKGLPAKRADWRSRAAVTRARMAALDPALSTRPTYDDQLPIAKRKHMGVIAMKAFGGGNPPTLIGEGPGKASATELLRYAMSQDIATVIPAVSSLEHLRQNLEVARNFVPMPPEEREAIITKINHKPDKRASITIPYPYRLA